MARQPTEFQFGSSEQPVQVNIGCPIKYLNKFWVFGGTHYKNQVNN